MIDAHPVLKHVVDQFEAAQRYLRAAAIEPQHHTDLVAALLVLAAKVESLEDAIVTTCGKPEDR